MRLLTFIAAILFSVTCFAATTQPASQPTSQPSESKLDIAVREAVKVSGEQTTLDNLHALAQPPGLWSKIKGVTTFANIVGVTASLLAFVAIIWLVRLYLWLILVSIPPIGHEIFIYLLCIGSFVCATKIQENYQFLLLVPTCLVLVAGFWYTAFRHFKVSLPSLATAAWASWFAVTYYFHSEVTGFMTVLAVFVSVGFSFDVIPGVVSIGFEDEDAVVRGTFVAFLFLIVHICHSIYHTLDSGMYAYFASGVAFMGTFVYFLGLLISCNKWYSERNLFMKNLIVIASGIGALYFGTAYQVPMLSGIGGTFFYLYIIELYYQIPWEGAAWAWSLAGLAGILYSFSIFAKHHPQFFLWHQ